MANYVIIARSADTTPMVSVSITAIDQENHVIDEIDIVNAVRTRLAGIPGVQSVVANKYEQIITVV